jgi:SAM-dependent methyltransferase
LKKADPEKYSNKYCADACSDLADVVGVNRYDLAFSHMFLEHIRDQKGLHRQVFKALKPGGYAIHFYPSRRNLPLFINSILPEGITRWMVALAQPDRDLEGNEGKFPAYYQNFGYDEHTISKRLSNIGFKLYSYDGYIGHRYYTRLKPLHMLHQQSNRIALKLNIPLVSFNALVLQKPLSGSG